MSIQLSNCLPDASLTCGVSYHFENLSGISVPKIRKVVEECMQNYIGSAKGISTYVSHMTFLGKIESLSHSEYSMVISCKKACLSPEELLAKAKDHMKAVPTLDEQKKNEEAVQKQGVQKFDLPNSKLSLEDFWILRESLKGIIHKLPEESAFWRD